MARRIVVLVSLFFSFTVVPSVRSQPAENTPPAGKRWDGDKPKRPPEEIRRKLEKLPPDEQSRFLKNYQQWEKLDPKQREVMKNRLAEQRVRTRKMLEDFFAKSGLDLNEEQKKAFTQRFFEERRKIEEEVKVYRDTLIQKRLEMLKAEIITGNTSPVETQESPDSESAQGTEN